MKTLAWIIFMKKSGIPNWINFILGAAIFITPWIIPHNLSARDALVIHWNFWIVGGGILVSAGAALKDFRPWEEWVNTALGIWLFISPFVLRYTREKNLMVNAMILGIAVAVLGTISLSRVRRVVHPQT